MRRSIAWFLLSCVLLIVWYSSTTYYSPTIYLADAPSYRKFVIPPVHNSLIISPQAGFGNRMRALSAGILIAEQLNRLPLHYWTPESNGPTSSNGPVHLQEIRQSSFDQYFVQRYNLPCATSRFNATTVDHVYTEWLPHHYWYSLQSRAQRAFLYKSRSRVLDTLNIDDQFLYYNRVLLLETSLPVRLSSYKHNNTSWFQQEQSRVYQQYFQVQPFFLDLVQKVAHYDMCINIRRGDLLLYFPEARQDPTTILDWFVGRQKNNSRVLILSNDVLFGQNFTSQLKTRLLTVHRNVTVDFTDDINRRLGGRLDGWQAPFLDFLIMAYRCGYVYGTPRSSFAQEASTFGGRWQNYSYILSN